MVRSVAPMTCLAVREIIVEKVGEIAAVSPRIFVSNAFARCIASLKSDKNASIYETAENVEYCEQFTTYGILNRWVFHLEIRCTSLNRSGPGGISNRGGPCHSESPNDGLRSLTDLAQIYSDSKDRVAGKKKVGRSPTFRLAGTYWLTGAEVSALIAGSIPLVTKVPLHGVTPLTVNDTPGP